MQGNIIYVDYERSSWRYMNYERGFQKEDLESFKIGVSFYTNYDTIEPFLIGKGKHMREDMPSSELAARHGKTLKILPPFGAFYLQAEREYWKTGMGESAGNGFDGPAR